MLDFPPIPAEIRASIRLLVATSSHHQNAPKPIANKLEFGYGETELAYPEVAEAAPWVLGTSGRAGWVRFASVSTAVASVCCTRAPNICCRLPAKASSNLRADEPDPLDQALHSGKTRFRMKEDQVADELI